jgi:hypothetical protein
VRLRLKTVVVVLGLAVLAAACRQYLPTNRYLQLRGEKHTWIKVDVRSKFDHAAHATALASAHAPCIACHRFDVLIETSNEQLGRELAARALDAGSAACHFCHVDEATRVPAAPRPCATCHDDLEPLRPEDHDLSWLRVHASMAQVNPSRCDLCHQQAQCIDCHQKRDTIETKVHERNYRFFHSIEARANPMKCGACHREDFCIRCHQKGVLPGEE